MKFYLDKNSPDSFGAFSCSFSFWLGLITYWFYVRVFCAQKSEWKRGRYPSKWRRERDSNSRKACAFDGFQDRCNQPLCHLSNNFSTYPSELRSDDGLRLNRGAYAPCSPISASLRCQDRCNQPLSFKTTGAVLVCTQNSPKGQEFFKNYLRLPIRRR